MTTRFPNGLTTTAQGTPLGDYILPAATKAHTFFDDFDTYLAADWTVTETGVATQALTNADGGRLLITNAAADDDASFSQKVGESFLFASGKKLWFDCLFQVSDATQSDIVIGLQITDTTPLAVSDGVYFIKADGATTFSLVVVKDSTATTTASVATAADATDLRLSYYYNGNDEIKIYADGVHVATSATTNLPDDEALTISYGIQNGEAVAKTMTLDYVFASKER